MCVLAGLRAQKYVPMLDSVNVWSYSTVEIVTKPQIQNSITCSYPRHYWGGSSEYTLSDTIINSVQYQKVYSKNFNSNSCLFGFVREDTAKKIIYFRDNDSIETVLYNFSMKLKDTINIKIYSTGGYFQSGNYKLDSIKTVTLNSKIRTVFHLNCHSCSYSHTLSWIEGIGNLGDFIYSYGGLGSGINIYSCPGYPHNTSQIMTCFAHKNKVYYDSCALKGALGHYGNNNYLDSCDYWGVVGGIKEHNPFGTISLSPNPATSIVTVRTSETKAYCLELVNMLGQVVFHSNVAGQDFSFDVSMLPKGLYIVQLQEISGLVIGRQKLIVQ